MTKALLTHVYVGTLIQACKNEGIDILAAQEVNGFGSEIQVFNWPDIRNLPKQELWLKKGDVPSDRDWFIIAQPPCSGGSMVTPGHSRGGLDNPRSAFKVSADFLQYAFPLNAPIIAIESVPGTLKICGDDIIKIRDTYGPQYGVSFILDNSQYHGCCSIRKRLWYVFWRRDLFPGGITWDRGEPSRRTTEEALSNINPDDLMHKVSPMQQKIYDRFHELFEAMPRGSYANNFLRKSGRWDLVPSDVPIKTKVTGELFLFYESVASFKLGFDKPCPTITGSTFLVHPTEGRPLTSREYLRMNGMPDSFIFPESVRHNQHVMFIGKTVAMGIAQWVIRNIKANLDTLGDKQ